MPSDVYLKAMLIVLLISAVVGWVIGGIALYMNS